MTAIDSIRRIAERHQLTPEFPDAVHAEVEGLLADPGIDDPALVDLSHLPFVTIDHEASRDLDQAAFVESGRDGGWVVWYALADPAHYVRPGSALFDEALRRGASYYLPGLMVPMLPRPLSEGIVSLNPDEPRRSMVFRMAVSANGEVEATEILSARIRSHRKLSFERVQEFLDDPAGASFGDDGVDASMVCLRQVGLVRMHNAAERNVVRYRRSEIDVKLSGAEGFRFVIGSHVRVPVERYNEQLSLMCNVEGARFLHASDGDGVVQAIFRVHPPPETQRVGNLEGVLSRLATVHGLDGDRWKWRRDGGPNLNDYLDALPAEGRLGRVARAIHRQAILINGRSSFRAEPGIHHGVGADVYARFSAPMREIVGVYLHKETWEKLGGRASPAGADEALRETVVETANRAKQTQKNVTNEANRLVLDQLFEDDLGRPEDARDRVGTVMGLNRGKIYLLLDDPAVEVKVYVKHLAASMGAELEASEDGVSLLAGGNPLLHTGDAANVRVVGHDDGRNRWRLALSRVNAAGTGAT